MEINSNKKCLFISTAHSAFKEPVQHAFERAGFEVNFVDYRGHLFLARDSFFRRVLAKLPLQFRNKVYQYAEELINKKVLKIAQDYQPDLIFTIKGKELTTDTLALLRKIAPIANWYPETVDHWGGIMAAAPHYTYFFAFDQLVIDMLEKEGIHNAHYLPFCADVLTTDTWPQEHATLKHDVVFIGSYEAQRADRERILAKVANRGLSIWGSKAWARTALESYYRGTISNEDMMEVYRTSKIVINHYITGLPGSGINLRPFEVTGCGALLINHDVRSDIFKHFKDGEEFISFGGEDDIRAKVGYYMEHEEERRRIAKNGFLRTQRDHTYDIRIATVLKTMGLK